MATKKKDMSNLYTEGVGSDTAAQSFFATDLKKQEAAKPEAKAETKTTAKTKRTRTPKAAADKRSERFTLCLTPELSEDVRKRAKEVGVSINSYFVMLAKKDIKENM